MHLAAALVLAASPHRLMASTSAWNAELGIWEGARAAFDKDLELPDPLYIFGYGSLCWKADFAYEHCWVGSIRGWHRRFAQRSTDHRGTPDCPGLVVTLLTDEELAELQPMQAEASSPCFGVCYKVGKRDEAAVLDALDFREKGGYTRAVVEVLSPEAETVRALLYTANPSNPHFYLPAPEEAARIIATAVGPSGANVDYLLNLAAWLERNKLEDAHVEELRRLLPRQGDR